MLWWLLWILLKSFEGIYWKKSLNLAHKLSFAAFNFLGAVFWIILGAIFYITKFEWTYNYSFKVSILTIVAIAFRWGSVYLSQRAYKNEKLSVLTPYENLNEILSIILAFLIFWWVSYLTFFLAISIVIVTFFFSVNIKKLKFPKFFLTFFLSQLSLTLYGITMWYIFKIITFSEYFAIEALFLFIILFITIIWEKQISVIRKQTKKFHAHRLYASILWYVGFILWIYITDEYGLVLSMIFSFLYTVFILILSFLYFWDIPTKRSIFFVIIVTTLVSLALYIK